jgi:hypothetical protein
MNEPDHLMAALNYLEDVVHAEGQATRLCVVVMAVLVMIACWWLS